MSASFDLRLVNLIVAISNLVAYLFIPINMNIMVKTLYNFMIWSSVLMHLSERKHGLPGIYPFNIYHRQFLWLDRIMAYICITVVCFSAYLIVHWQGFTWNILFYVTLSIIGLGCLGISEYVIINEYKAFAFFHSVWHIIAYYVFCSIYTLFIDQLVLTNRPTFIH